LRATDLWELAQDLNSRLGIDQGYVRLGDYRDQVASLILGKYKTRRAFCKATGLAEDLLSHVLAGRKHFGMETLVKALDKIGYRLEIRPNPKNIGPAKRVQKRRVKSAG
jgi:hypothetical protein